MRECSHFGTNCLDEAFNSRHPLKHTNVTPVGEIVQDLLPLALVGVELRGERSKRGHNVFNARLLSFELLEELLY